MKVISRLISGLLLAAVCLAGCQDDDIVSMTVPETPDVPAVTRAVNTTSSLVQDSEGYWTATKRVPIVGRGRIVDNIANSLIGVISTSGESNIGNLVDDVLTNEATVSGGDLADIQAVGNQLLSVRDLNHTYAAGQTVGFTYKVGGNNLLSVDVLKGFWIATYKDGVKQDSITGVNQETNLLNLNLLSTLNDDGIQSLSVKATKPFDEVKIGMGGITVDLLNALELYYVFVGDNEITPLVKGNSDYPNVSLNRSLTSDLFKDYGEELVDENTAKGVTMELIIKLLNGLGQIFGVTPTMTVDLGQTVEAGTELGFYINEVNVLEAGLLNSMEFWTYDENDKVVEKITVEDGGLLGVSAIGGGKSLIGVTVKKPCSQIQIRFNGLDINIGATTIYYAYAREKTTVDVSSYFPAVTEVNISGNSYHLPQPKDGKLEWQLAGAPKGSSPVLDANNNKIINMMVNGDYVLTSTYTYTNQDGEQQDMSVRFIIHRNAPENNGEDCNQLIGQKYGAKAYIPEGGGALISTENVKNIENVVDDNPNNYAIYQEALSLASDIGILGIELGEGKSIEASATAPKRVGFTIQTSGTFLSADILNFFRIKLYNDGKEIDGGVVDENNTVSADLIGSQGNKVRIAFTTEETFDRIELWSSGILTLNLSDNYRIYNAFFEDDNETCVNYDASEACIEMLTAAQGAEINYKETVIGGAATVAGSFNDLGNIIDDDKLSYATISSTTVLGTTQIAVKFDEMPGGTQAGFIVSDPSFVLNGIGVLSGTTLKAYYKGNAVGTSGETGVGDVVSADLIGYGGRAFIEVCPTKPFDEIRLSFPAGLDALDIIRVNGAYVRRDSDSDGIPDCAEDDENLEQPVLPGFTINEVLATPEHACGNTIRMNITEISGDETALDGVLGQEFTLQCDNLFSGKMERRDVKLDVVDGEHGFTLNDMPPGDYYITISKEGSVLYSNAHAALHPDQTVWTGAARDGDWNNWQNWSDGAPWTCTNVIIPGNCADYPELVKGGENNCANLHLGAGAELVNAQYLKHYDLAWVELSLAPNMYYMLSAPLKSMVTGDFFVPQKWAGDHSKEDYFTRLTPMTAPESRFTPRVYQRFWSSEVPGKVMSEGALQTDIIVSETNWTAPFNAVAEPYAAGMGFSVRTDGAATFRFPKTHTEYTYFDGSGSSTGLTEGVARQDVGHLVIDGMQDELKLTVENHTAGTTFVVGNPFLAHIDIQQFLAKNPNISSVKLSDGQAVSSIMRDNSTASGYTHIAPMQAFYVEAKTAGTTLEVTFTAAMQAAMPGYNIYATSAASSRAKTSSRAMTRGGMGMGNTLRLTAECDGRQSTALVTLRSSADDAYRAGEDSKVLIDTDMQPAVVVFTTADGHALDIQQRRSDTAIPVGFRMQKSGRVSLTLSHDEGDVWSRWSLVDSRTGRRYPLSEGTTYVDLGTLGTHAGRFYLEKN